MHLKAAKWKVTFTQWAKLLDEFQVSQIKEKRKKRRRRNVIFLCVLNLIQIPIQVWINSVGILHLSSASYRSSSGIMLQPEKRYYCTAIVSADVTGLQLNKLHFWNFIDWEIDQP